MFTRNCLFEKNYNSREILSLKEWLFSTKKFMAKNIEINYNNGTSYDVLYPKTLASQVTAGTFSGAFTFDTSATFSKGATFTTIPSCSVTPTSTSHLANKSYVDSKVSAISVPTVNGDIAVKTYVGTGTTETNISLTFPSISGKTIQYIYITAPGMMGMSKSTGYTYDGLYEIFLTVGTSSSSSVGISRIRLTTANALNLVYSYIYCWRSGNTVYFEGDPFDATEAPLLNSTFPDYYYVVAYYF